MKFKVPQKALWGAQTQRALENFKISGIKFAFPFGRSFIEALGIIKFSAASANQKLKLLEPRKANAIKLSAKEVISKVIMMIHFPWTFSRQGRGQVQT